VDLLGEHLTEGTPIDREILAEHEDLATIDSAPAGDDAIAEWAIVPRGGSGAGQRVELVERALIKQVLDPFAGEHLAAGFLPLDRPLGTRMKRLFLEHGQCGDSF